MEVRRWGEERLAELEPLWRDMHAHHGELEDVPPVRPFAASWAQRQEQYRGWLRSGEGVLLVAEVGDAKPVGYLMLTIGAGPATWDVGDKAAEIESIAVLTQERSGGVGKALMDAAIDAAAGAGATAVGVGVVHSNAAAIRFYERAGFKPFYLQMLRVQAP
jgi:ribosomal protein S18 acetylase RimI-like enzyme